MADGECDCLLVVTFTVAVRTQVARNGHHATRDVRRTTEEQALREHCISDLAGVEDVPSQTPLRSEARRHYARYLPRSGADLYCVCACQQRAERSEVVGHPHSFREVEPWRYEAVQATGRWC